MDLGIKGRVAIVTGGSRGIGKETAREFLEAGVKVMTCSRHGDELNETCKELAKTTGGEIHSMVADMTNPEDIKNMIEAYSSKMTKDSKQKKNIKKQMSNLIEKMNNEM